MNRTLLIICCLFNILVLATAEEVLHSVEKRIITIETDEGQQLLEESLSADYDALKEYWVQQHPSHCGVASSVIALNTIEGNARLNQDNIFTKKVNEIITKDVVSKQGVTLFEIKKILSASSKKVSARRYYADIYSVETFREDIKNIMVDQHKFMLINLSNQSLRGEGMKGGHFSPIGAYHEESDMVFVYEVNPKKRPSYWVKVKDLHTAMRAIDPVSKIPRGWVIVKRKALPLNREIPLNSDLGEELMVNAISLDYNKQRHFWEPQLPSHCGVCSAVIVLNAIENDNQWTQYNLFTERVQETINQQVVSQIGLTLREIEEILNITSEQAQAQKHYAHLTGLDLFRKHLKSVMLDEDAYMILNFSGHFSPTVAYNEAKDMLLVHEVSAHKTREPEPYWISIKEMYKQMLAIDPISKISRGWVIVRRKSD